MNLNEECLLQYLKNESARPEMIQAAALPHNALPGGTTAPRTSYASSPRCLRMSRPVNPGKKLS